MRWKYGTASIEIFCCGSRTGTCIRGCIGTARCQSAISRQISNLENELGVQLFERVGRNVHLTSIGKIFLTHIKSALKGLDYAKKQVDEYLDPERGSIKIGFPTSLASNLLPTVLSAFKKSYPNIRFQLRQGSYNFF